MVQKISLISFNIRNKTSPTRPNLHINCATWIEIGRVPGKTLNQFKSCHAQLIYMFARVQSFAVASCSFISILILKLAFYRHGRREREKEKEKAGSAMHRVAKSLRMSVEHCTLPYLSHSTNGEFWIAFLRYLFESILVSESVHKFPAYLLF